MTVPTITVLPTAPARTDAPATFNTRADAFLGALYNPFSDQMNASIGAFNTDFTTVATNVTAAQTAQTGAETAETAAEAAQAAAESSANATIWVTATAVTLGDVRFSPINFLSYRVDKNLTTVTNVTDPSLSADWVFIGGATLGANTFTGQQSFVETIDTVYAITDGANFEIDPVNGNVQTITLGAARTALATNFAAGQSIVLGVDDGTAYALTWPTMTWVISGGGGAAPTLATSGYTWVMLWKQGSTLFGSIVGSP